MADQLPHHSTGTTTMNVENNRIEASGSASINFSQTTIYQEPPPVKDLPPCELPDNLFCGRHQSLHRLHQLLTSSECHSNPLQRMVVIVGLGGIGKSSLARKYAELYKTYHVNIAWINAGSRESLVTSFLSLASHLHICPHITQRERSKETDLRPQEVQLLVRTVYTHFAQHVQKGLFIFDDANQVVVDSFNKLVECASNGILSEFMPTILLPLYPLFLLTSWDKNWGLGSLKVQTMTLDPFEEEEALICVKKGLNIEERELSNSLNELMAQLTQQLGYYPLALRLATSAILANLELVKVETMESEESEEDLRDVESEIRNYIKKFQLDGDKWIHDGRTAGENVFDRYDKIIATVWHGTVERIRSLKEHPSDLALDLLSLVSYLPTDHISIELCHFIYRDIKLNEFILDNFNPEELRDIRRAFGILSKYSLITVLQGRSYLAHRFYGILQIRIHRLVQKWTREHLKEQSDSGWVQKIANYYENNRIYFLSTFKQVIVQNLKESGFPERSYRHYIYLSLNLPDDPASVAQVRLENLKEFYKYFLKNPPKSRGDMEYFCLGKMALVYFAHNRFSESGNSQSKELLDNSDLFDKTDLLCKVSMEDFIFWTATQAELYSGNQLVQKVAGDILYDVIVQQGYLLSEETEEKVVGWLHKYKSLINCKEGVRLSPNTKGSTSGKVMGIANKVYPRAAMVDLIVRMVEALVGDEEANYFYHLDGGLDSMDGWPKNIWIDSKSKGLESGKVYEGERMCLQFLSSGGLNILKGLSHCETEESIEAHIGFTSLDGAVEVMAETVQILAFFDKCARILLEFSDLMDALKIVGDAAIDRIQKDMKTWDIDILLSTLFCFVALLGKENRMAIGSAETVWKDMERMMGKVLENFEGVSLFLENGSAQSKLKKLRRWHGILESFHSTHQHHLSFVTSELNRKLMQSISNLLITDKKSDKIN